MFRTSDSDQHPITSLISHKGNAYWSRIEVTLQLPWFIVRIVRSSDDAEDAGEMRHFILPDERVLDLAQLHRDPHIWVESVLMVSPGFMNGSSDWQMNSLAAIWTSVEPDAPSQYATVYELDDGRRYVRSALGSSLDSLPPPKLIADFRNHRAAV